MKPFAAQKTWCQNKGNLGPHLVLRHAQVAEPTTFIVSGSRHWRYIQQVPPLASAMVIP